jgi:hypothetical protein
MKRLFVMAVVGSLAAGCAAQRLLYAGPIKLTSEPSAGLMLEGPNSRLIACVPEEGSPFTDLRDGQWVVVEGAPSRLGKLVIRLEACRVVAAVGNDGARGPALGECRRVPSAGLAPVAETPNK